jgi:hypothetical protein
MEHNIEKLLQSKILTAEREPVSWRKDATWERIQAAGVSKERKIPVYYAYAAACALIAAMIVYGVDRHNAATLDERIDAVAICIDALRKPRTNEASVEIIPTQCPAVPLKVNPSAQLAKRSITVDVKTESFERQSVAAQQAAPQHESAPIEVMVVAEHTTMKNQPAQKVRPIIGIVVQNAPEPMIAKQKKNKKIKFFPLEKDAPLLDAPEPTTLSARIN